MSLDVTEDGAAVAIAGVPPFSGFHSKDAILLAAHRGIESITLDRGAAHLKDELMPKYAELVYYGFWYAPEREMLQALIDKSQERVSGRVRLKLYKGNARVVGRQSPYSLYDQELVTFEDGAVADIHTPADAEISRCSLLEAAVQNRGWIDLSSERT